MLKLLYSPRTVRAITSLTIGLLLVPTLYTAIHSDEVYGFIGLQGTGVWASPTHVLTYPFSTDLVQYFLTRQGRIVPFSTLMYQGGYWISTQVAVLANISVVTVYSCLKALLVAVMFVSLRAWIYLIARNFQVVDAKVWATDFSLLVSLIFAIGARLDASSINGLVTYPMLTYPPIILCMGLPALIAKGLESQSRRWNTFSLGTSIAAGLILPFSYELNFVAAGAIILTLLTLNRQEYKWARVSAFIFITTFTCGFVLNRVLVADACLNTKCYEGTNVTLGAAFFRAMRNNVLGTIPLKHTEHHFYAEQGVGAFTLQPGLYSMTWWLIAAVVAVVTLQLLRILIPKSENLPQHFLLTISGIMLSVFSASCILTSASGIAQNHLEDTVPYRGYVLSWGALSIVLAGFSIKLLGLSQPNVNRHKRAIALAITFGFMTLYLRPFGNFAMAAELNKGRSSSFQKVTDELIQPVDLSGGNEYRCKLVAELGSSRQAREIRSSIDPAFVHFYGIPFCLDAK